jgi:D-alanine-D-alanine ligase
MRKIAVVGGGNSSEFEISIKSARAVQDALSGNYDSYLVIIKGSDWYWEDQNGRAIPVNKDSFSIKLEDKTIRFDAVFIAIHGKPGENGQLQGYLDMIGIPYSSCDAFCSALTFNKHACKLFLKDYNIPMARWVKISKKEEADIDAILNQTGLPCFVKPNDSGSSFGVSKVNNADDLPGAIKEALKESDSVLIESIIVGTEVCCGVFKSAEKEHVLPITEIRSKNEFFDYEAKYNPEKADEITPAEIPENVYIDVQSLSSKIYDLLDCKGLVRVDFIITDSTPFFIEINSVPGMTEESIIPKQINAYGILPSNFYSEIIESLF